MPQITQEEKDKLSEVVKRVETWLEDNVQAQAALTAFETPAFTSTEVLNQLKPLTAQLDKLLKKPKPVPPKVGCLLPPSAVSVSPSHPVQSQTNSTNTTVNATTDETSSSPEAEAEGSEQTPESEPETIRIDPEDLRDSSSIGDDEL